MAAFGCTQSMKDPQLCLGMKGELFVILSTYVDDVPLYYIKEAAPDAVISLFKSQFEVRVNDGITLFLGTYVDYEGNFLKFLNAPMIRRMLDFFMADCMTAKTPLSAGKDLNDGGIPTSI